MQIDLMIHADPQDGIEGPEISQLGLSDRGIQEAEYHGKARKWPYDVVLTAPERYSVDTAKGVAGENDVIVLPELSVRMMTRNSQMGKDFFSIYKDIGDAPMDHYLLYPSSLGSIARAVSALIERLHSGIGIPGYRVLAVGDPVIIPGVAYHLCPKSKPYRFLAMRYAHGDLIRVDPPRYIERIRVPAEP